MEVYPAEPHQRKTGHQLLDFAVSACALLISSISIYMGWTTGDAMEKLVHANSWPFLQMGSGNSRDETRILAFSVANAGTGPARIHTFQFMVDGKPIPAPAGISSHLHRLLEACCSDLLKAELARNGNDYQAAVGGDMSTPIAGSFLPPRDEVTVQSWRRTDANARLWDFVDRARQKGRIAMRSCYCSVFDECWVAQTHKFPPRSVKTCPSPGSSDY